MQKFEKYYYTTGEFAKLAKLHKKTLHYYDEIGLFRPSYVHENGYRYYSAAQFDRLALILTLRDLGVALKDIKAYLQCGDVALINQFLSAQEDAIAQQIQLLKQRSALLASVLESSRDFQAHGTQGYYLAQLPETRIEPLDAQSLQGHMAINYITDGPHTGMCLHAGELLFYRKHPDGSLAIPAGQYLCLYSRSPATESTPVFLERQLRLMHAYAQTQQIQLEDRLYNDFSDVLFQEEDGSEAEVFWLRARVL